MADENDDGHAFCRHLQELVGDELEVGRMRARRGGSAEHRVRAGGTRSARTWASATSGTDWCGDDELLDGNLGRKRDGSEAASKGRKTEQKIWIGRRRQSRGDVDLERQPSMAVLGLLL